MQRNNQTNKKFALLRNCAAIAGVACFAIAPTNVFADTCFAYNADAEYQLVFEENFDGTELDNNKWNRAFLWGPGVIINNEEQYYVNEGQFDYNPFTVSDGTLKISAIKTPFRRDVLYLTRSIYSASTVELLWRVPAGAVRYEVYREGELVGNATGGSFLDSSLDDGGDFQFEVIAFDANDREILRGQTTINTGERDIPVPARPFALYLDAQVYGPSEGELVWDTPNRAGHYDVYLDGTLVQRLVGADFSSLYVEGLEQGVDYNYEVRSFDRCGEEIVRGNTVLNTANPSPDVVLDARLKLSDVIYSKSTAELSWNQVQGAAIYEVVRDGAVIQANAARSIFIDGLIPGIDRRFVVNALDADGNLVDTRRRAINTADNSFALNRQAFLSGIITSYDAFRFLYGRVEARAKMPAGKGMWSAFWLLNGYYNEDQPEDPEIDIIEAIGDQVTTANHAYHYNTPNGRMSREFRAEIPDFSADFHTYAVDWSPGRIIYFIDGQETHRLEGDQVSDEQMYIIANLAVGGDFPGPPDEATIFPATFELDYVRVWQRR